MQSIENFLEFALEKGVCYEDDKIYLYNKLLDIKEQCEPQEDASDAEWELYETRLWGAVMLRPSEINAEFWSKYGLESAEVATEYLYQLEKDVDYIKTKQIAKNVKWDYSSKYGNLEITINLSKPEKDPRDIAKAIEIQKKQESAGIDPYPKCLLCKENEGFAGNLNHPARQNIRLIPLQLNENDKNEWYFQYSPYSYYNEHCIILSGKHSPMHINKETFKRMLTFLKQFPHYFIGSNTDIPIVGGSILTHDHYQGGRHQMPMVTAETFFEYQKKSVKIELLKWPLSTIRLTADSADDLVDLSDYILQKWIGYSDESVEIVAVTKGQRHNAITPIARVIENFDGNKQFQIDLVLRNNRTSEEYPDGIFHPHKEWHHIKKENIGLIEVMGLAILPGRLKADLESGKYTQEYIGEVFEHVLEDAGVFKQNEEGIAAFKRFCESIF
ncbi:MAG: UDP-glucose--hexose-1-phosphate uridylyltransferase [Candidatus Ancillula sp.]|jgi:UDPglucose--hexose-1-phosphate uridylyltransferase|nr:UDP-glucose--hexose-1-phosphate uridylyltransferase [Candidatus Ancillula sp.]